MQTTIHPVPDQYLYQETFSDLETGILLSKETLLETMAIGQTLPEATR
jgi:hypothetical protein